MSYLVTADDLQSGEGRTVQVATLGDAYSYLQSLPEGFECADIECLDSGWAYGFERQGPKGRREWHAVRDLR